jgi:hypothetical protein
MALLYLAFTDNVGWRELFASAITGAISVIAAIVFARAGQLRFSFRMRDVVQAWRMPWYAVSGTVEVLQGLAKQLFSPGGAPNYLAAVRYDMGSRDDPADCGRRALEITLSTATPNFIILGFVDRQDLLLYHQITPGEVRVMTRKLGARP